MARPLRLDYPGAVHHIYSRGNNYEKVLICPEDKDLFIDYLKKYIILFQAKLIAYIIMDNHFHLLVESGPVSISRIMQNLLGNFTIHINKKYGRVGHLFQGRFKSCLVEKDLYLVNCVKYIHNNCLKAGIIDKLEDYKWSSYKNYINNSTDSFLTLDHVLNYFNFNKSQFIQYMNNYQGVFIEPVFERKREYQFYGSKSFIETVLQIYGHKKRVRDNRTGPVNIDIIKQIIKQKYNVDFINIQVPSKIPWVVRVRKIIIFLIRKYSHYTLKELSAIIDMSISGISKSLLKIQLNDIMTAERLIIDYL